MALHKTQERVVEDADAAGRSGATIDAAGKVHASARPARAA